MSAYIITDGKGSYIHKDSGSGKYVPIKNIKKATRWDNISKANSVLHNCIPKNFRNDYCVLFLNTDKIIEKSNLDSVCNKISSDDATDSNIDNLISQIKSIIEVVPNAETRKQELNENLSIIDKKISDIEHYIEFGKFNAYQGWLCFKSLQSLLHKRRNLKNELQVIRLLSKHHLDKESLSDLSEMISNIQNNKIYTPRVLSELFAGEQ